VEDDAVHPVTTRRPVPTSGIRRWAARVAAGLAAAATVALGVATPASAHSTLLRTTPASGATVTAQVPEVTLVFSERVNQKFTTVVVTGPDGGAYARGGVRVVDESVHQALYPTRSGAYHVTWRAVSADGHPVQGAFTFDVTLPAGQEPAAPPTAAAGPADSGGGGGSLVWLVLGGAVVVVAGAVAVARRGRVAR
jgi:methionine-rich copper-binding protein CopC